MLNNRKPSFLRLGFVVSVCVTLFQFSLLTSSHVIQIFPIYLVYVCMVMLVGFNIPHFIEVIKNGEFDRRHSRKIF